ncbi:MAG: Yip1 family protein [Bacteroidales bacterium]
MSNGTFDFNAFIAESKETLLNPKSYFSTMKTSGGIAEPLIKAVIYGTLTGIFYFLWSFVHLGTGGGLLGSAVGFMAFIYAILSAVIGLFIGAVILLIISSICKGNTDFEANMRVTAAVMVVMPISALLSFTSGLNLYLGAVVSIAVSAYSLWLLYHGLVESLKGNAGTARIVCYVFIAIMVLFLLIGIGARSRAQRMLNEYNKDAREILKDLNK